MCLSLLCAFHICKAIFILDLIYLQYMYFYDEGVKIPVVGIFQLLRALSQLLSYSFPFYVYTYSTNY